MKKYTSLGDLIIDFRSLNSTSQADLAAKFDVDIRTIIRWEKNETLLKPDKEEEMVNITFIPYQVIRNLNAPVSIPIYYDFDLRKYSLSELSNELPDPNWMKSKMEYGTERLRAIKYGSDIDDIIKCSLVQKHISKPIRKDLIYRAIELLPELNLIIFDTSGYYSGHCVFFPLSQASYQKIRNKTLKEEDLSEENFVNYKNEDTPVFYAYDISADCNENIYYITGAIMRFLKDLTNKKYLFASYTSRHDTYEINEKLGATMVWEDKQEQAKIKSKAPPRLYEHNFTAFLESK